MKQSIAIGLSSLTIVAFLGSTVSVAQASFGNFMLGVGAAAGTSAVINANRRATEAEQRAAEAELQRTVSAEEEFFRGLQDALNGLPYDNFRATVDYDQGFQEGVRRLQSSVTEDAENTEDQ
jgi:hypothetical protein